jgi:hypothetical protein
MLQLNPFLTSIAAPAAAKTVQAVVHAAHQTGQSFLKTFAQFGEQTSNAVSSAAESADTLQNKLANFSAEFRDWLDQQGVDGNYELQFHLAENGDPIANVVGSDSSKIVDLLYGDNNWLDRLSALAAQASQEAPLGLPGTAVKSGNSAVKLSIRSDDAYVLSQ